MEKIQKNMRISMFLRFGQENHIKAHVCLYFLHLVLTFTPHYIIMVKGPLHEYSHSQAVPQDIGCSKHIILYLVCPCRFIFAGLASGSIAVLATHMWLH